MTIGIAACGSRAGLAVLEGLKIAEAVGHGALHGFVSLVGIGQDGRLHRAETQNGGAAALLSRGPLPELLASATRAGLMSSGPNRPSPLSQFTPADAAVGLVTGHRFPNAAGRLGTPLNLDVLRLMGQGLAPEAALSAVVADNPFADAGFIALSHDGRLHMQNTPYLASFGDAGHTVAVTHDGAATVAVLHNAIQPHRSLASLVAEVALDVLSGEPAADMAIILAAGVPLRPGAGNALDVDDAGLVLEIEVGDARYLTGSWSLGTGYRTPVRRRGVPLGRAMYEPYLRAEGGTIVAIDGQRSITIPMRLGVLERVPIE